MGLATLALLVFGIGTWILWRAFGLCLSHAVMAALFGFFLAESRVAPYITEAVRDLFGWISTWHL